MDDGSIVELYLARDEGAIARTSEKYVTSIRWQSHGDWDWTRGGVQDAELAREQADL